MILEEIKFINYSEIALTGQAPTHEPQEMQRSLSICATPSTIEIACTGQISTQVPQPAQTSLLTTIVILHYSVLTL